MRTKLIVLALATLSAAFGQQTHQYSYFKQTVLSTAAEKVTLQQPATGAKRQLLKSAWVHCTVDATVTLSINGTAATTTAGAVVSHDDSATPAVSVFHTSNVGSGTTVLGPMPIAANVGQPFDLSGMSLNGNGTAKNFTVSTSSVTGTCSILIVASER